MTSSRDLLVSVQDLCFTREIISVTFSRPRDQEHIDDAVALINEGYLSPRAFPNMRVVEFNDRLWSLDNRRLWVFKKAKVPSITVTLCRHDFHDGFQPPWATSPRMYKTFSRPNFFPRCCTENFTENFSEDPDLDLPSSLSPPARGGRHFETHPRIFKPSNPSAVPHVREPDRPLQRSKCPPSKVAKMSSAKSKHLYYECHNVRSHSRNHADHRYDDPSHFRNQDPDLLSMYRRRGSVVPTPSRKYSSDEPSLLHTKKRHHETQHRHQSSQTLQEACFPRPSKKHRAPSQVRQFKDSSPSRAWTPIEEYSSHPAQKSKYPTHEKEFKVTSPPLSRRRQEERHSSQVRELKASPSMPRPPIPTQRACSRPAKEAGSPSLARTTRSSERKVGRPINLSSCRITDRKAFSSSGQPSRQDSLDKLPDLPSLHSQKGRAARGSTSRAPDKPTPSLAPAPKRSKTSKATSNPKNFSYDFHSSRKRPKASKGSKKAVAQPSTNCLSTQLPDNILDVSVPSPASPKTQCASPEKPREPLLSSSTTASLATTTKKVQSMDNFSSDLTDPNENQRQHPTSGMLPATKARQEQEAPEVVQSVAEGAILSETESKLFKLDIEVTPIDPELPRPSTPFVLDAIDQQIMKEITEQILKDMKDTLQPPHIKLTADTLQREPLEAESPNEFPSQTPIDVVLENHRQDEPQDNAHESVVDCPIHYDMKGQLFESALNVLGPWVNPSSAFYGDGDVHQAAANVSVTVMAGSEPPNIQASTPVKDVLEPESETKAGSAINHHQGKRSLSGRNRDGFVEMARTANSQINLRLSESTQANPILGNEVQEVSKRITRGQLKKQKEIARRKEREKRKALREAVKTKERGDKSSLKQKSGSASKHLTTAIVPYDATRSKDMSSGLKKVHRGDMAYIKVNGELAGTRVEGRSRLHPYLRFLGPFRVIRQCNAYSALVELPDDCDLNHIFSLTVLTTSRTPLENCSLDKRLSIALVPEKVLNKRVARRLRKRKVIHYLVKWKSLPLTEATWEPEIIFDEYPHLLEQVDDSPVFSNPYLLRNWKA